MKHLTITLLLSAAILCGSRAHATCYPAPDSIIEYNKVEKVVIKESADGTSFIITDRDSTWIHMRPVKDNETVKVSRRSHRINSLLKSKDDCRNDLIIGGLGLGFVSAPGEPSTLDVEPGKSFEINWLYALGYERRLTRLSYLTAGIGFAWRNYKMTCGQMFAFNEETGTISASEFPSDVRPKYSRIKIFSIQFPVLYTQYLGVKVFNRPLGLKFGPVFNLNTYSSVRNEWEPARTQSSTVESSEYFHKQIGQRKFTVDILAGIKLGGFGGIYVRYSPMTVLKTTSGAPRFHSFSTGVMLGF